MTKTEPISSQDRPRLLRQILLFVLPLIATSVLQLLFNTADSIVVGQWGGDTPEECEAALAAVGSCGSLINLIVNLFMGLSIGAGVLVARGVGARDERSVDETVHTSVLLSLVLGIVVAVIGFTFSGTFLVWMGTTAAALEQATLYMKAYFLGIPAAMIYNYCAAMLRATGDTVHPLAFLTAGGVLNVGFNLLAVLVLRLGAMGVGLATAASNWLACILVVVFMLRKKGLCHLDVRRLRLHTDILKKVLYIGIPAGVQSSLFSISNVLIQSSINSFQSTAVVAGNTAGSNIEGYIYATQNAIAQAALTYVSQYMGAKRPDLAHRAAMLCTVCVTVAGLAVCGVAVLFGHTLLGLFNPGNEAAIEVGMTKMSITTVTHFLCGLMEVGCNSLRGLGKSVQPTVVALIGACGLRILWIYTAFAWFPTLEVLYMSYPVTWAVTALTQYTFYSLRIRKVKRVFAEKGDVLLS